MKAHKAAPPMVASLPETRSDLHQWIRDRLHLSAPQEQTLIEAVDAVFLQHERLWEQSKQDAIQAVSAGFAERITRMREEISARDATVSNIATYFENLVTDLTDRVHRDPKTRLINFRRFIEQVEAFLALEQRGRWCTVGLVDITAFKWYNDTLGHAVGDRIIDRVAGILSEQIRSDDLMALDPAEGRATQDLHARFGGDEFCFLIPDLEHDADATMIAERFRNAVAGFEWAREDPRLAEKPVTVDVGIVCFLLGPVQERRAIARELAQALLEHADRLMYEAKGGPTGCIPSTRVCLDDGALVQIDTARGDAYVARTTA